MGDTTKDIMGDETAPMFKAYFMGCYRVTFTAIKGDKNGEFLSNGKIKDDMTILVYVGGKWRNVVLELVRIPCNSAQILLGVESTDSKLFAALLIIEKTKFRIKMEVNRVFKYLSQGNLEGLRAYADELIADSTDGKSDAPMGGAGGAGGAE